MNERPVFIQQSNKTLDLNWQIIPPECRGQLGLIYDVYCRGGLAALLGLTKKRRMHLRDGLEFQIGQGTTQIEEMAADVNKKVNFIQDKRLRNALMYRYMFDTPPDPDNVPSPYRTTQVRMPYEDVARLLGVTREQAIATIKKSVNMLGIITDRSPIFGTYGEPGYSNRTTQNNI
jgi:hypothetical protein